MRHVKILLALLVFCFSVSAQTIIKKTAVEGEGTPLVMLPGGTVDISALSLVSRGMENLYKVIRMDNLNVQYACKGQTLPKDYSVQMEAESVKATLDSLKVTGPIILMGHSYGGLIALEYALKNPENITALILIEPPVFGIAEARFESPAGMKNMIAITKELTPDAVITEDLVARFRCELLDCETTPVHGLPQWPIWLNQRDRLRGLSAVGEYRLDLRKVHRFKPPVLILTGTESVPFHKRINALLTVEFTNSTAESIESDHAIPSKAPSELVKCLRNFLKRELDTPEDGIRRVSTLN
ncbi:MAG TPA: alpha/beta hydrolase [Chryseolinea sp.]